MFPWDRRPTAPAKMRTKATQPSSSTASVIVAASTLLSTLLPSKKSSPPIVLHLATDSSSSKQPAPASSVMDNSASIDSSPIAFVNLCSPTSSILNNNLRQPISAKRKLCFDNNPCKLPILTDCITSPATLNSVSNHSEINLNDSDSSDVSIIASPIKKKKLKLKNADRFLCQYVIKKGSRKGEKCEKYVRNGTTLCSIHSVKSKSLLIVNQIQPKTSQPESCITSIKTESKNVIKLKINRLKYDEKYFLLQTCYQRFNFVLVKNKTQLYKIRIPQKMHVPEGSKNYLIRERLSKQTVWKNYC